MKPNHKFNRKNPANDEEKLITELIKSLDEVTHIFVKLNFPEIITDQTFIILRDASIGYAGGMIRDLMKMLADKNQISEFAENTKQLFDCYIDQIRDDLK